MPRGGAATSLDPPSRSGQGDAGDASPLSGLETLARISGSAVDPARRAATNPSRVADSSASLPTTTQAGITKLRDARLLGGTDFNTIPALSEYGRQGLEVETFPPRPGQSPGVLSAGERGRTEPHEAREGRDGGSHGAEIGRGGDHAYKEPTSNWRRCGPECVGLEIIMC